MTIEEIIKSTSSIAQAKRTVLNIMYTNTIINDRFGDILKSFEISMEQFNVLRILRGQKGKPANMCLIQERMLAKTSNTTRLVDKLLSKALVTREICSDNRRKIEVQITDKGQLLLQELDPLIEEYENSFIKGMSESELLMLNQLLEKFRA